MKKVLFGLIVIVASCTSESIAPKHEILPAISIANGRLVFANQAEFKKTIQELITMDQGKLDEWELSNKFKSYRQFLLEKSKTQKGLMSLKDDDLFEFPSFMQAVLNKSGEVQIGDTIIWYSGGNKYSLPKSSEMALPRVKNNDEAAVLATYSIGPIMIGTRKENETALSGIGYPWLDARHQHEFLYLNHPSNGRKFVHELASYTESTCIGGPSGGCGYESYLYIRMKLEWWSSSGWQPAGDARWVEWNMSVNYLDFSSPHPSQTYISTSSPSGTASTNQYIVQQVIGYGTGVSTSPNDRPIWNIDLTGYMYQWMYGDYDDNGWMNNTDPLW